jgi:predicted Rossmann-fold nucleotide-binding protein
MITWRGLGIHAKAIIFLDEDDYWAPFFALISHGVEAGLVAPSLAASIGYAKSVEVCFRLLEAETSKPPDA